jgi:hypothetical protein
MNVEAVRDQALSLGRLADVNPPYKVLRTQLLKSTLQRQNTEIWKQIFPEKEYRGLSPNFHIHASVSDLYISTIGLPILLEEICRPILGIYRSLTDTLFGYRYNQLPRLIE